MNTDEYLKLTKIKDSEAQAHRLHKLKVRERIASIILKSPEWAMERANEALRRPAAPWQEWSRIEWRKLIRVKSPQEIADLLTNPDSDADVLSDSHPFAACLHEQPNAR